MTLCRYIGQHLGLIFKPADFEVLKMNNESQIYLLVLSVTLLIACDAGFYDCFHNDDCKDERLCCSITPALGKRHLQGRQIPPDWDGMVHYCLPWKNENATWCSLRLQYSDSAPNYHGLCPCGPGLQCTPTDLLDETHYPRDRYGKCTPVSA